MESIFFLLTSKSFRKKYNKSIIKENKTILQIKGLLEIDQEESIKISYDSKKKRNRKKWRKNKKN
mgnify:CR=1 FL=1